MSAKWLAKEGRKWVEGEIISAEQLTQIQKMYEHKRTSLALLPLLASILIGLGILTFIAANWQWLLPEYRIGIMLVIMLAFYGGGFRLYQKEQPALGISLIALGLVSFGSSLILIGQTYQLVTHHTGTFVIWAIAGIAFTYLFRNAFLFIISLLILHIAQVYSLSVLSSFSWLVFILILGPLGYFAWKYRTALLSWLYTASLILQSVFLITDENWGNVSIFVCFIGLYALGEWLQDKKTFYPLQVISIVGSLLSILILIFLMDQHFSTQFYKEWTQGWPYIIPLLALLGLVVIYLKWQRNTLRKTGYELILFLPIIFLQPLTDRAFIFYLIILFVYSIQLLMHGFDEQEKYKVNLGTFLFLISALVAYIKLTWGLFDRSLFFVIGGLLLFGLSWFLNHRRASVFADGERGDES
jgi:uncharacterized membrane protein